MSFVFNGSSFIADLFNQVQTLFAGYSEKAFQAVRQVVIEPLGALIALYYTLMGISITYGWLELSMRNLVKSAIKVSLIYSFALNWDLFLNEFINVITSIVNDVSHATMSIGNTDLQSTKSLGDNMQQVLDKIWAVTEFYWKNASWHAPLKLVYGAVELILGCLVLVPACGYLLVSQGLLALLFGLAPLCIGFMLFKPTQPFFNRWISEITGQAMAMIFVSAALGMVLTMLSWAFPSDVTNINPAAILGTIFTCLISFAILKQAYALGRNIGEGFAVFCHYNAINNMASPGKALSEGLTGAAVKQLGKGINITQAGWAKTKELGGNAIRAWRNRNVSGE